MANVDNLEQYEGKRVSLVRRDPENPEQNVEVEGRVESAMPGAIAFKPKGKSTLDLIEADQIENITLVEENTAAVTQSVLQPVKLGSVRRHLADRHGVTVSEANGLTEEQATERHNALHEGDKDSKQISHRHGTKPKGEVAATDSVASESGEA